MDSGQPFPSIMILAMIITAGSRTTPFDAPSPLKNLRRFSFKELKCATHNFSASNSIGKGGSGSVFKGVLKDGKLVAVKVLDPVCFQGEYEFQNEVRILGGLKPCRYVIPLLGFCVEERKRLLVYEYMPNRSLQELLIFETDDESNDLILSWSMRFSIILDVVKALFFLHLECNPPVIHGDVKPSNILLDSEFRAKISDFGLSRLKVENENESMANLFSQDLGKTPEDKVELQGSTSTKTSSCGIYNETMSQVMKKLDFDGNELSVSATESCGFVNKCMAFDVDLESREQESWWWKQDESGELCSKDYVMGWIRNQIYPSQIPDWDVEKGTENLEKTNMDESLHKMIENQIQEQKCEAEKGTQNTQVKKHRTMVEWWNEEQQLNDTNKKVNNKFRSWRNKRIIIPHFGLGKCFTMNRIKASKQDEDNFEFSFRRGFSVEKPSPSWSGDILSRDLSSTTSVRGTFCYVAPEYSEHNYLIEKADIYSLGVLILVTISGRRPLQMLSSPMKFEKANLISWTKRLAHSGNILELVDKRLRNEYNKEEAILCIKLALSCLQKMPDLRPDIGNVLRILNGEMGLLATPWQFSPPPPLRSSHKTRRKQRNCTK